MLPYEELIADAKAAETRAQLLRDQAEQLRRRCPHVWGETKYTPDYQEAYTIPGDPPGTMGVDWRGPCHVPAKTTPKWSRTCTKCGYTQTTERKKMTGGVLQQEVPDFGD